MPLDAANPVVVTQAATTYDKLRITSMVMDWRNPNQPVSARVEIVKSNLKTVNNKEVWEDAPKTATKATGMLTIGDLYKIAGERAAAGNTKLATAITAIMEEIKAIAEEKHII